MRFKGSCFYFPLSTRHELKATYCKVIFTKVGRLGSKSFRAKQKKLIHYSSYPSVNLAYCQEGCFTVAKWIFK